MIETKLRAADGRIFWSAIVMTLAPLVPYAFEGLVL
jgi:hypothetical protein